MKLATIGFALAITLCPIYSQETGTTTGGGLIVAGTPIYAIFDDGVLGWQFHRGVNSGTADWANRGVITKVGTAWNEGRRVFKGTPSGSGGVIYRVDSQGDLYWYKHVGWYSGSKEFNGPSKVGMGWSGIRLAFGAGRGVIYAVDSKGDLNWYRHLAEETGEFKWANGGIPMKVGVGWGQVRLGFSGGNGIVYLVDSKGDLYWYKHLGYLNGKFAWANNATGIKVGSGWNDAASAFSGGDGVIYVLKRDGNLYWYKHTGFETGTPTWASPAGNRIGAGWGNTVRIF